MKLKMLMVAAALASLPGVARAEMGVQDLLNAVDKMTPDEAQLFCLKLEAKYWQPLPEGFFTWMSVSFAAEVSGLAKVKPAGQNPLGNTLDLNRAAGGEVALLWNMCDPKLRLGLAFNF